MDLLKRCLRSLQAQTHPNLEIVVVDNGSTDGSAQYLRTLLGNIKTLALDRNTGFTGGNIAGLELADGEFIALVNNDVELSPDWVARHVEALRAHPAAGSSGGTILRTGPSGHMDSAGGGMTTSTRGFNLGEGQAADRGGKRRWVFWTTAAAAMYRRSMLEEVGFLDDLFFFGCEDADLGFRAQLAGWKCLYLPEALAVHHVNASHRLLNGKAEYYFSRNIELTWLKNMPSTLLWRYLHHHLIHEAAALVKRLPRPRAAAAALLGKLAVVPLLPHALRERHRIQAIRKLPLRDLDEMLIPVFSRRFIHRGRPTRSTTPESPHADLVSL
jgi:GT2 family glycosyltransferase